MAGKPGNFINKSSLEEVISENSALTQTESIANSSIYNEIIQDINGFEQYYQREQKKAEETSMR